MTGHRHVWQSTNINPQLPAIMDTLTADIPTLDRTLLDILAQQTTPQVIPELIETYLQDTAQRVTMIQDAATSGDIAQISHEAHSLKSSSGAYGALQVCAIAKAIEQACKNGNTQEALALAAQLPALAERSIPLLRQTAKEYARQAALC